ncbi:MAG: asparagine synthase (glutamine-hydrolyzing) [Bacteroidota bacterium]|nr:asparagine synthase (glutamine-hydrolyzing) [Bacteroidota bacterium]
MCGIAGIIGTDKVNIQVEDILQKIRYRGPDGLFYWKNEMIAFGHARLKIIDLTANANQPMVDNSTGNVIIFNGEIYNYLEIKKEIGAKYDFRTDSDTEVILAAYKVYGIAFFTKLRGMFAFALYDKALDKILLARDRLGIKPLYYRKVDQSFVFASEIKAIINLGKETESLNEIKVYEFLANRQLDTNHETFFKNVNQLPPAHYLWVNIDGSAENTISFWNYPELGTRQFDEKAKQEFLEIFNETIAIHLRSDVEVGSFLSGGIDSSSVTCFALRNIHQPYLHTFSGILPYHHPENALIDDVLSISKRLIPHKFQLDGASFFEDVEDVIYHHDEPILDGSMYSHYKLCKIAGQNGIKVLLSGSGGDELFGGYSSYINAHHSNLLSNLKIKKYLTDVKKVANNSSHSYSDLVIKSLFESLPFSTRRNFKNRQIQRKNKHLEIHPFIEHYYYEDENRYYANLLNNYKSWTVPPFLHYEDRNSMAFGIEIRVPFYDHQLMDFIFQFSPDQVISGSSKSILRNSFNGIVPEKVLSQKGKYGFPSPLDHVLATDKRGKELFFDLYRNAPFLKQKETEKLGIDFYNGKGDLRIFWRTLSYVLWYSIFFGQ